MHIKLNLFGYEFSLTFFLYSYLMSLKVGEYVINDYVTISLVDYEMIGYTLHQSIRGYAEAKGIDLSTLNQEPIIIHSFTLISRRFYPYINISKRINATTGATTENAGEISKD